MLQKDLRLPVHHFSEKSEVFSRGNIIVVKTASNNLSHFRVGVVIAKGVVRGAVKRNSLKRFIFNFFKEKEAFLDRVCKDILIIYKPRIKNIKDEDIRSELEAVTRKLTKQ